MDHQGSRFSWRAMEGDFPLINRYKSPLRVLVVLCAISLVSVFGGPADDFADPTRWEAYNATLSTISNPPAAIGGEVIGDSVFWVPQDSDLQYFPTFNSTLSSVATIYNLSLPFQSPQAWSAFNLTRAIATPTHPAAGACQCSIIVSNYMLLCSLVMKDTFSVYDKRGGNLTSLSNWSTMNVTACTGRRDLGGPALLNDKIVIFGVTNQVAEFWMLNLTRPNSEPSDCALWTRKISVDGEGNAANYRMGNSKAWNSVVRAGQYLFWATQQNDFVRYDTLGNFTSPASWTVYSIHEWFNSTYGNFSSRCVVDDAEIFMYCPTSRYNNSHAIPAILRFDTRRPLSDRNAWLVFDLRRTPIPYDFYSWGLFFKSPYLYIPPLRRSDINRLPGYHYARYDSRSPFLDPSSWQTYDARIIGGLETGGMAGFVRVKGGSEIIFAPSAKNNTYVKYTIDFPSCTDPAPAAVFECRNTTWVAFGNVTLSANATVSSNVKVDGNLIIPTTIAVLLLPGTTSVAVAGCFGPEGSLVIIVPSGVSLTSPYSLFSFNGYCSGTSNFSSVILDGATMDGCSQYVGDVIYEAKSISVLFRLDRSRCATPVIGNEVASGSNTIFLITVIVPTVGGLLLILIVFLVIAYRVPSCKERVFPFSQRGSKANRNTIE